MLQKQRTSAMFFLILEELIRISPARTVIIYDTRKSNKRFCATLDLLGQNNFRSKLRLKTSNSFVWKLHFRQKRKLKVVGTFQKFWMWGAEIFSDRSITQTPCDMAVILTKQRVSMETVWLFNVAPLDGRKERHQKRLILCNIREAYLQYKSTFPDDKVGLSKFAELQP